VIVTLLTDYGRDDEFVGVCHGVIARVAPDVRVVDITHGVPRHGVREGAIALRNALPYFPVAVHVAVVDPQVGTERRAVALRCGDGRTLVGPDNGLLSLAWDAAGGVLEAVDVTRSPFRLEPVSATFHGRDVFAPVGAHLAAGEPIAAAGDPVDPDELQRIELPRARIMDSTAVAHALVIDTFGNVALNLSHSDLLAMGVSIGDEVHVVTEEEAADATFVRTFADVGTGEMLLYEDAWGALALAVNRGHAAAMLGAVPDGEVRLTRR
jgi:S-adenosylmethionine hydrolase